MSRSSQSTIKYVSVRRLLLLVRHLVSSSEAGGFIPSAVQNEISPVSCLYACHGSSPSRILLPQLALALTGVPFSEAVVRYPSSPLRQQMVITPRETGHHLSRARLADEVDGKQYGVN